VRFDKITARIKKLSYGLDLRFCDPVGGRKRPFVRGRGSSELAAPDCPAARRRGTRRASPAGAARLAPWRVALWRAWVA
jgi:hypothetical protein